MSERPAVLAITSVTRHPSDPRPQKRIHYGCGAPTHQLIYKLEGENYTCYGGERLHMRPDVIGFLPQSADAEYYVDRLSHGDCIDVYFITNAPLCERAFCLDAASVKALRPLFIRLHALWTGRAEGYDYQCMALLYEILASLEKTQDTYLPRDKYTKISAGIEYLRAHCFDPAIDLTQPARLCSMSYTYFKQLFKAKFSLTPIAYVTELRMEQAAELLSTGHYGISTVAALCGYSDVYYFSRAFKKYFGCPPSRFNAQSPSDQNDK